MLDAAYWAVCLVLVASGATKVAEPDAFARALDAFGVLPKRAGSPDPMGRWAAVIIGLVEIGIGFNALVIGGPLLGWMAAIAFGLFTVVVLVARARGLSSCGCFGARSGTPNLAHAALNAGSSVVCGAAALTGPVALADGLDGLGRGTAIAVVAGVLAVAAAIIVADTR